MCGSESAGVANFLGRVSMFLQVISRMRLFNNDAVDGALFFLAHLKKITIFVASNTIPFLL